jgi:hypothetical protein
MRCLSHEQEQLEAGINPLIAAQRRCAPERSRAYCCGEFPVLLAFLKPTDMLYSIASFSGSWTSAPSHG